MKRSGGVFRSALAAAILVALTQADNDGYSLRTLARATQTTDSAVQRALGPLVASGLVRRSRHRGAPRYVRDPRHPVAQDVLRLAMHELGPEQLASVLVTANDDVEFAALAGDSARIVFAEGASAASRLRLQRAIEQIPAATLRSEISLHRDAAERATLEPEFRERIRRERILKGSVERTFPKRTLHGDFQRARRLGDLHPTLLRPSRRSLQKLARDHALKRLAIFGSAVRSDFRPDSDVDVLVARRPGSSGSLSDIARLQRDLELLLHRDVDVIEEDRLEARMRPVVEREKVVVYGRP